MKSILLSALALGVMTTAAMAEPQNLPQNEPRKMSEDQMADVAAGLLNLAAVIPTNLATSAATAAAIGLLAEDTTGVADSKTSIWEDIDVTQVEVD